MTMTLMEFRRSPASGGGRSPQNLTDEQLLSLISGLGKSGNDRQRAETVWLIVKILTKTKSAAVRNAAALALADLQAVDASGSIVDLLHKPSLAGASGSLLYALNELGASIPLEVVANILEHGSSESREEALVFVEDRRVSDFSEEAWRSFRAKLRRLAKNNDETVAEASAHVGSLMEAYLDTSR